jgi:hypothetical protein
MGLARCFGAKKCGSLMTPARAYSRFGPIRISYDPTLNGAEKNESAAME